MIWNCEAPIMIECGVCHCLMLKQSIYLSQSASVASLDWSAILQGLTLPSTVFHITRYLKTIYWRYQRFEPRVSCTRSIYCPTGLRSFPKGWTVPLQFADVTFHGCTIVPTLEMIMILAHSGIACLLGQSARLFPWRANFPTWKVTPWEKQHVFLICHTLTLQHGVIPHCREACVNDATTWAGSTGRVYPSQSAFFLPRSCQLRGKAGWDHLPSTGSFYSRVWSCRHLLTASSAYHGSATPTLWGGVHVLGKI